MSARETGEHPEPPRHRYALVLLALYAGLWTLLAFGVTDRVTWALENGLTVAGVVVLILTAKRLPFGRASYTLIFVFACLHTIGAHYTYSEVPYDRWCDALCGNSVNEIFGWERNHYDRFLHFGYGLLLTHPVRELWLLLGGAKGFWGTFFPLTIIMSTSVVYELIEWGAAICFGDGAVSFLGTQGDPWDAQWDMMLATAGALLCLAISPFRREGP